MKEEKQLLRLVCPHCGEEMGERALWPAQESHWQGEWCCGSRDVYLVPAHGTHKILPPKREVFKFAKNIDGSVGDVVTLHPRSEHARSGAVPGLYRIIRQEGTAPGDVSVYGIFLVGLVEYYKAYTRAVWPSAQSQYDEAVENGLDPSAAMVRSLEGVSWAEYPEVRKTAIGLLGILSRDQWLDKIRRRTVDFIHKSLRDWRVVRLAEELGVDLTD